MLGLVFAADPAAQGAAPTGIQSFLNSGAPMFIIMIGIFYFLLIRPQQKKAKEHRALLDALKKGDTVSLVGFGSFGVKERAERQGRNPRHKPRNPPSGSGMCPLPLSPQSQA